MNDDAVYMVKEVASKLAGKTINVAIQDESGEFFGFRLADGTNVWVLQDPEGNGPGWLSIEKE